MWKITRARINDFMRQAGNTRDRPEQIMAADIITMLIMPDQKYFCATEFYVNDLKLAGEVDYSERRPRLDIALKLYYPDREEKFAIRCMGPPHEGRIQKRKDYMQLLVLEHPANGWKVIDFWHNRMPNLWALNKPAAIQEVMAMMQPHMRCRKLVV